MSAEHLIKMANQIARNQARLGEPEDTAVRVADHLTRFWAKTMHEQLIAEAAADTTGAVNAVVRTALELIAAQK
ncbi:MAG: formate dehydrogenase subunit delta [Halieaceae bacterium]|jgi:formate dehydrogenase subunit delta